MQGQALYKPTGVESRQYTEPLRDVPQSVTVVPRALIEEQNAVTLRDVLRNVPGISMQAGEGGGGPGGDFLSIRGFNARNDVYIDDIRDFGGYSRDPFNFEQVEVVKGPASSYTGRGSTGGSINLVSKAPALDCSFYHATLGIGTDEFKRFTVGHQPGANAAVGRPDRGDRRFRQRPQRWSITGAVLEDAPCGSMRMWTEGDVSNRDEVENSRWGIAPSLAFGFGHDATLTLSYFHMEQDNVPDYGIPWVPTTQAVLPPELSGTSRRRWTSTISTACSIATTRRSAPTSARCVTSRKSGDWFSLRNTVSLRPDAPRLDHDRAALHPGVTDPSVVINRQFQARDQTDTIIAEQFDMRFSFETFGREARARHRLRSTPTKPRRTNCARRIPRRPRIFTIPIHTSLTTARSATPAR